MVDPCPAFRSCGSGAMPKRGLLKPASAGHRPAAQASNTARKRRATTCQVKLVATFTARFRITGPERHHAVARSRRLAFDEVASHIGVEHVKLAHSSSRVSAVPWAHYLTCEMLKPRKWTLRSTTRLAPLSSGHDLDLPPAIFRLLERSLTSENSRCAYRTCLLHFFAWCGSGKGDGTFLPPQRSSIFQY